MPHVHFQSRSTHRVLWLFAAALAAIPTTTAGAAPVRQQIQPLAAVGSVSRPVCDAPTAPFPTQDFTGPNAAWSTYRWGYGGLFDGPADALSELGATVGDADLQPIVTICSPTFQGLPGPISGSIAMNPRRARVGQGWRELGGALAEPAQLLAGDSLEVPEVDDAARVRLAVAPGIGQPTTVLELSDLAPGPSKVAIARDARGLVATITRADGTTAEAVGAVTTVPALNVKISGTPSRWKITSQHLPGTTVLAARDDREESQSKAVRAVDGRSTTVIPTRRLTRGRASTGAVSLIATNRAAQVIDTQYCRVALSRKGTPRSISCKPYSTRSIIRDFGDYGYYYSVDGALKAKALEAMVRQLVDRPAAPQPAARSSRARKTSAAPTAQRARAAAPLTARLTQRTAETRSIAPRGLKPLAADVNGDGAVDYWTDEWNGQRSGPLRGSSAGMVLVSGPAGLTPHRVDLPGTDYVNSDISAIADVTGDGIGELIVDQEERHGVIPGSANWTGTNYPLVAPDLTDFGPQDRMLRLALSSPGAPFGALDDVTGDGKAEIAAADDSGAWFSIASQGLLQGAVTDLPSFTRPVQPPGDLLGLAMTDPGAPHVSPVTRIIGGQAIGLRWPVAATTKAPTGTVSITVKDALGRDLRPAITLQTPGNALLLDYDPASGDALLLAASASCTYGYFAIPDIGDCEYTLLRIGADGKIQQRLLSGVASTSGGGPLLTGARFLPDGPDADTRLDVAISEGVDSVALLTSTASGEIKPSSLPVARLIKVPKRTSIEAPLRLYPVVSSGGARRLMVPLPTIKRDPYTRRARYFATSGTTPAELAWK